MKRLQALAWFNVWVVGIFGFGLLAALNGGAWNTILIVWLVVWGLAGMVSSA